MIKHFIIYETQFEELQSFCQSFRQIVQIGPGSPLYYWTDDMST